MIRKQDFYNADDYPAGNQKKLIWDNIESEILVEKSWSLNLFDRRSFAFGFAMALISVFAIIGLYKTFESVYQSEDSSLNKLNEIYSSTIEKFESELPVQLASFNKSQKVDDFIFSGKEEIQNINSAIYQLKSDWGDDDLSPIKQTRLLRLYKMKLELLEKLIVIEENAL